MTGPADYKYDVFFSYKRHPLTLEWTRNVRERLQFWLDNEVGGRNTDMFIDTDTIELGDNWPEKLREGLRLSRCMVAVWSPSYFQSNWCVSEWQTFLERERVSRMNPHGLIAPIRFHDGEHFPPEAKNIEMLDLREYASTEAAFWQSSQTLGLESQIKSLARSVARILRSVPPFQPDWSLVDSLAAPRPRIPLGRL